MELKVLDLFCGMGGFSLGFAMEGFIVIGVDKSRNVAKTYLYNLKKYNEKNEFIKKDLNKEIIKTDAPIIIGSPPCKPWSPLNTRRKGASHQDYICINAYFNHILANKPLIFIFENVPQIENDPILKKNLQKISQDYDYVIRNIRYSDYGAPTKRKRLFIFAFRKDLGLNLQEFLKELDEIGQKMPKKLVKDVIGHLVDVPEGKIKDHEWHKINFEKYGEKIKKKLYGCERIKWDDFFPSKGNLQKVLTLHPLLDRSLSIKENLLLMGFPNSYEFPEGLSKWGRYQMIADAVSPTFSNVIAKALKKVLK